MTPDHGPTAAAAPDAVGPPPTAAISLGYAAAPSRRRRRARRVLRWWPAFLLATVAGLGAAHGPRLYERYELRTLQEACMTATMPEERPMGAYDPAAKAVVDARPGEYQLDAYGQAVRVDPRWAAFSARLGAAAWYPPGPRATEFCHERHTPDGRRRLVVVEGGDVGTVIEPVRWVGDGDRPVVRWRDRVSSDRDSMAAMYEWAMTASHPASDLGGPSQFRQLVPDPADRSRFTSSFVMNGVTGVVEYRLGDDDRVTARLVDAEGLKARAAARVAGRK